MADLYLPIRPLPRIASPSPVVFGGWQGGASGGEETWLGFVGSRMALGLETPNLLLEPDGRVWSAAIMDALFSGAIVGCRFHQPGFETKALAAAGTEIRVDGANQAGSVLKLHGLAPGAVVSRREFFSIVTAGRRCVHYGHAQGRAGADGRMPLQIVPPLHVQPNDGDRCEFGEPMIEGKLTMDGGAGFSFVPARVQSLKFKITEIR